MNPNDADRIVARVMSAWTSPLEPSARAVWQEHLAPMDYPPALAAVKALELGNPRRPSLAEFHVAYRIETDRTKPKSLPAPATGTADSAERYRRLQEWLAVPRELITEKVLDEAGVVRWRERLASAEREDIERGTWRREFDRAWAQIRRELGRPDLILPDGTTYGTDEEPF